MQNAHSPAEPSPLVIQKVVLGLTQPHFSILKSGAGLTPKFFLLKSLYKAFSTPLWSVLSYSPNLALNQQKLHMQLKPLGDRIVVKPATQEEVTKSGIVLPDTVDKEKKEQGEVIAIGTGEKIVKLGLKLGDLVLFGKYSGDEVEVEDIEYKILKDEDVLAILQK